MVLKQWNKNVLVVSNQFSVVFFSTASVTVKVDLIGCYGHQEYMTFHIYRPTIGIIFQYLINKNCVYCPQQLIRFLHSYNKKIKKTWCHWWWWTTKTWLHSSEYLTKDLPVQLTTANHIQSCRIKCQTEFEGLNWIGCYDVIQKVPISYSDKWVLFSIYKYISPESMFLKDVIYLFHLKDASPFTNLDFILSPISY